MADLTPAQQMAAAGGYKQYSQGQKKQQQKQNVQAQTTATNIQKMQQDVLNLSNFRPLSTPVQNKLNTNTLYGPATGNERWAYMGRDPGTNLDQLVRVEDARYMFYTLDDSSRRKVWAAADAWYGKGTWKPSWLPKLWERAINVSANALAYSNAKVDPITAFKMVIQSGGGPDTQSSGGGGGGGGGGGYGGGGGTSTAVSTSTTLTNATDAQVILDNALTNYLGRKATKQEQDQFVKALNKKEAKNPTITTQTVTAAGGKTQQQTASAGGFNPSTFADKYAQGMEGSAEYQAATSVMDSFISALKAQV